MSSPDKPALRALIYNRVSSDPTGHQVSVTSQDIENRAFCVREGWEVVATISDNDRSASRHAGKEREGYKSVQTALTGRTHGRIDVIVCWEASRAQRDMADYVQLRDLCARHGVLFAYKGRIYDLTMGDDRFATGLDVLVAEREAELIRERALRGHRNSAAKGRPRGQVPYGYQRDYSTDPFGQVPDPETSEVVKEVVRRVLAEHPLYAIAADLNRQGVPTPQGHKELAAGIDRGRLWSSATIRVLLASQSMTGVRTHNGVAHAEATWEPIVSLSDWETAQVVLADPWRARHHRGVAPRHLLAGIAECAVCGAWLRAATNRGRPVYQCAGHGVGHPRGKGHVSRGPRDKVDALALLRVWDLLESPDLLASIDASRADVRDRARDIRDELATLTAKLARFEAAAVAETISLEAFGRFEAQIAARTAELRAEQAATSRWPVEVVEMAGPGAKARWNAPRVQGDVVYQRRIVRALVRVVVRRSKRPGVRGFDAASIDVVDR